MPARSKPRKRPCSICGRWFAPAPKVAHCQKTCSPECSRELTAKRQKKWRRGSQDYDQARRLHAKLKAAEQPGATVEIRPFTEPLARLPWPLMQTALGAKMAVILAFALLLQSERDQTALQVKIRMPASSAARLSRRPAQTAMATGP